MRSAIYSPLNNELCELMKSARIKAGMTQVDLAKATGRTQAYISKFEHGQLRLDVEDFIKFAKVLDLDLHKTIEQLSEL